MDEKEFIQMEPVLQKISKTLSLGDDKKDYVDAYEEIRSVFLQALRTEDPIFNSYKKIQLMGSSYEKTRIRVADEFDMNICIKLPFDYKQVIIENGPTRGFVTIKIPGQLDILKKSPHWGNYKSIDRWIDKDDFVLQNKFREWMQSVSQKAIDNLKNSSNAVWSKYNVMMKPVGPSIGLWFTHRSKGIEFSVDFVPVLVFKHPIWPSYVPQKYADQFKPNEWYAVPKHSSNKQVIGGKLWRISFPQQECDMLKGKNQMRVAQRMIKQLRENREFTFLKSYFIKSVFMLMVEQKKGEPLFWEKRVSYLFMFMLNDLLEKVTKGHISFFWDRSYNLLSVLTQNQLNHCRESLQGSIAFIKKNIADEQKISNFLMPGGSTNTEKEFAIVPKSIIEKKQMCVLS